MSIEGPLEQIITEGNIKVRKEKPRDSPCFMDSEGNLWAAPK